MKRHMHLLATSILALVACSAGGVAQAQEAGEATAQAGGGQLAEIIVTARKQSESLIDVPVAVSAVGGAELAKTGVNDLNRIAQLAPQVIAARSDQGSGASFTIRGIGSSPQDQGIEQSVTLNIDGVQVTRGNVVNQGFFDLQQVEVLKGPQALFFGKNSPAGVISLRSINPTDTFEGYLRGGYEFVANERYLEGAVSGPITDTLKARLALRGTKMRGWIKNVAPGVASNPLLNGLATPGADPRHNPDSREVLGRLTVLFEPSSDFDATLKISAGKYKDNDGASSRGQAICAPANPHPTVSGLPDTTESCKFDNIKSSANTNPALVVDWPYFKQNGRFYTDLWSGLASLTMNYNTPVLKISSVTGFFKLDSKAAQDAVYSNFASVYGVLTEDTQQFSQEIRAVSDFDGPLNFTLGAYYEDVKRDHFGAYLLMYAGPDAATGKFHTFELNTDTSGRTVSAFGQLRYDILDNLQLAGGARWTHERKKQTNGNIYVHSALVGPFGILPAGQKISGRFKDTDISPEVTLSWHPMEQTLVYAAYKTGYKSGGFSSPSLLSAVFNADNLEFKSESSEGFELGMKTYLADRTIRLEATAYRYNYKNLQLSSFDQETFSFFVRNAANARIQGFELSGEWAATREFRLNGAVGYNRARYTNFPRGVCYSGQPSSPTPTSGQCHSLLNVQDLKGKPLTRAPDWSFNLGADYTVEVGSNLKMGASADVSYTGSYFTQEDQNPMGFQDSFARINASLRVGAADDRWELALIGRNLTNEFYLETTSNKAFGGPTDLQAQTPRPREVRVQGTFRF